MPTKRTRVSLINSIIPNMNSNWNEISTKLRQAFENFRSTYNDDVAKLASQLVRKKRQVIIFILLLNTIIICLLIILNYRNPSNHDIEEFISGTVWEKPLKKHLDILDYNAFKTHQLGVKALKSFVAISLKVHVEYLVAEAKGENPDYTSILNRIKGLDNITIDITFPAASHLQYANQLELSEEREKLKN
jgi:hypothetical protein